MAALIKRLRPTLRLVVGGPEVGAPDDLPLVAEIADHVLSGEADLAFPDLCRSLLAGEERPRFVAAPPPDLAGLRSPLDLYDDEDLANRILYVETTRGCPHRCAYCTSSTGQGLRRTSLEVLLAELAILLGRGPRHVKLVDRTLNADPAHGLTVLRFLRQHLRPEMLAHIEVRPDMVDDDLLLEAARFPPGALQIEAGVQTLDPEVGRRIDRPFLVDAVTDGLLRLRRTGAHVHADLIAGLPGESLAGLARGFDRLISLGPQEIQLGILKRLRGTSLARRADEWGLVFSDAPPYEILATPQVSFSEMQGIRRFARHLDLVHNSGRFPISSRRILEGDASPFAAFAGFSTWLQGRLQRDHSIALPVLAEQIYRFLVDVRGRDADEAADGVARDYLRERREVPEFLRKRIDRRALPAAAARSDGRRQRRHLSSE